MARAPASRLQKRPRGAAVKNTCQQGWPRSQKGRCRVRGEGPAEQAASEGLREPTRVRSQEQEQEREWRWGAPSAKGRRKRG
eukprot:1389395-Alexandrium_andersonii.AAC.1